MPHLDGKTGRHHLRVHICSQETKLLRQNPSHLGPETHLPIFGASAAEIQTFLRVKAENYDMKTTTQAFAIHVPDANGDTTERIVSIDVPVRWDEMIDEWVLTEEAHEMIDKRKAQELGLLSPVQLREVRERHRQNQKQMGALFQVGEKSWSRWESGKHRPTRSMNLLIRSLYDGEISINYLREKAGMEVHSLPASAASRPVLAD